ncbi:GDT1-like protein 2, chloroplastic [Gracilariopsis chorda]|uniref:GDT1 family protein n=1 Tax=Gracilariopsis chorda TaxID=448386 RepID=A0A2V3J124_9FLOR|nr:GDT1-like protein 2, chloroplastic [Gracilariopsis chorda]|eukprot:PXF47647.1 GDT1-like protein 2, chloroplastic [Gracilariopsis chorda]
MTPFNSSAFVSGVPVRFGSGSLHSACRLRPLKAVHRRLIARSSLQTPPQPPQSDKSPKFILAAPQVTRVLLPLVVFAVFRAVPAFALGTGYFPNPLVAPLDPTSFLSALTASFALVLASELGDKTFFISALLSMKHSRLLVFLGTMLALAAMTVISVVIGQLFHALPPSLNTSIPFDDYAAVALLLWFGFQSIKAGLSMSSADDDELQDAKDVVAGRGGMGGGAFKIVAQTTSLIFLAEWGDKSMLATVALAAAKSPWGVIVGGISGHFVASIIAVVGGSFLGNFVSERSARLIGGVLFFVFAFLTIFGIY